MKNNLIIGLLVVTVIYIIQTYYFIFGPTTYNGEMAMSVFLLTMAEFALIVMSWMNIDKIVDFFGGE